MSDADPLRRFESRAQDYAAARPAYAPGLVAAIAKALDLPGASHVVDLGCGTGISARAFLDAGHRVTGIEPNGAMLAQARAQFQGLSAATLIEARAEATGLAPGCADLLIAAQAFHWFDVPAARTESLRIGRAPVRAALIWNDRDVNADDFSRGYEELVRSFGDNYDEIQRRHNQSSRADAYFGHAAWQTIVLRHADQLTLEKLLQRIASASYMPQPGHPRFDSMRQAARDLFERNQAGGTVTMPFETRILCGRLAAASGAPVPESP